MKRALWRRCHFHATNILQLLFAIRVQCKSNKGSELLVCYIELFNQNMQSQKFCRQRHGGFCLRGPKRRKPDNLLVLFMGRQLSAWSIADGSGIQSPVCRSSGSEFSLFSLHGTCRRQTHVAATVQSATDPRCCYRAGPPVLLCIPPRISQILNLINSIHQETYSVSFLKEYLQRLKQMN